jgi:hypothetical protein
LPSADAGSRRIAVSRQSASTRAILTRSASESTSPSRNATPATSAAIRAAGSIRVTRLSASSAISRPPTSSAAVSTTSPFVTSASLLVPPPTSTFRMVWPVSRDRATAPEPCAAITVSRLCPAEAHTNLPASDANRSAMERALVRFTASPVRMIAPVSTWLGVSPASSYDRRTKSPSWSASIV